MEQRCYAYEPIQTMQLCYYFCHIVSISWELEITKLFKMMQLKVIFRDLCLYIKQKEAKYGNT